MARITKFGFPTRVIPQSFFEEIVTPLSGFTDSPPITAPSDSFYSGQNVWIKNGAMFPRSKLSAVGTGTLGGEPNGFFLYDGISGGAVPVITSQDTVAYLENQSFTSLTYVSGTSNLPPTGGPTDEFFGTTVYLERTDINLGVFTNGLEPLFAWDGHSSQDL